MAPKKNASGGKGGRPIGSKTVKVGVVVEDLHPELQSGWMELQPMVVYDDEKVNDVNEIHKLMKECAAFFIEKGSS